MAPFRPSHGLLLARAKNVAKNAQEKGYKPLLSVPIARVTRENGFGRIRLTFWQGSRCEVGRVDEFCFEIVIDPFDRSFRFYAQRTDLINRAPSLSGPRLRLISVVLPLDEQG